MDEFELEFSSRILIFEGQTPWYYLIIPKNDSRIIKQKFGHVHRGWGSIPVKVQTGKSKWKTSIFWQKDGTYMLPLKKEIRNNEKVTNGDKIKITILIENVI